MKIRVLTINVWNREGAPERSKLLNREIKRISPDLISFQEVMKTSEDDQLAELVDGMGFSVTHQADMQHYTPPFSDRFGGAAVATRWPHRRIEVVDSRGSIATDVPWATIAIAVPLPDLGDLIFIGATSSWRLNAEAARERQALSLADLDSRHRCELPTIIAGDFNASPEAASIRFLTGRQSLYGQSAYYHDAWTLAGDGPGLTWTAKNPNAKAGIEQIVGQSEHHRRMDYVFVGGLDSHPNADAKIRSAQLVFDQSFDDIWLSDHYGLLVELDIVKRRSQGD